MARAVGGDQTVDIVSAIAWVGGLAESGHHLGDLGLGEAFPFRMGEDVEIVGLDRADEVFADPLARQLYAEISSIEEQHVTQYESIIDPRETWLEKWLLHEACEVYNYYGCLQQEDNPRIKKIWERFVDYELGHLHLVMDLFQRLEKRDPLQVLPAVLPEPFPYKSNRGFVRQVLSQEVELRTQGPQFVTRERESRLWLAYRALINADGSPSEAVAAGYRWAPGTELAHREASIRSQVQPV